MGQTYSLEVDAALKERRFDDAVTLLVKEHKHVTFVEIGRMLSDHIQTKGHLAICLSSSENLILWAGMSEEFYDVMRRCIDENRIFRHSSSPLTYMVDGGGLNLPVARTMRAVGAKKDYWIPVCFCSYPMKEVSGKKKSKAG
jgi:hypothetical protein